MVDALLTEKIKNLAESIGIDALGFADASEFSGYALSESCRRDPRLTLADAETIIVAGIYIGGMSLPAWSNPRYGRTSRLYLSGWFLDVVKPLEPIVELLKAEGYEAVVCDGTADGGSILPLKLSAIRAGLGWQGKHSLLISKTFGTFLALGGIITNAVLEQNIQEAPDRCRECEKCQQACPLDALNQAYVLNMKKCLSYCLQVEHLPEKAQAVMENRVGDCEICQQACPWNKKHLDKPLATQRTEAFQEKAADWERFFYLPDLVNLTEKDYTEKLGHFSTGIPFEYFHRNVLIAKAWADKRAEKPALKPGDQARFNRKQQKRGSAMIEKENLGKDGPRVGRLGYGAMVLEGYYGESDDDSAIDTLVHAIDGGMMIDTADAYGGGHNESLIAKALKSCTREAFIATKFGIVYDENDTGTELPTGWGFSLNINGTPQYAHKALDASLTRLGVDVIDLWYIHYFDPATPVEESVGAMARAVEQGKVRYLGLSNAGPEQVRRAHAVHPISAVQYEYSLWRREVETDLMPTLRELGIALVAWSPLGGGFFTGTVDQLDENDFRQNNPRFAAENLDHNREQFAPFMALAEELGISPAQLTLAWLLHQGRDIFPIPGTRTNERIDENAKALTIELDDAVLERINEIAEPGVARGATLL